MMDLHSEVDCALDVLDDALGSQAQDRLRGHELVQVTAYRKAPSGQMWVDGVGSGGQLVSVRLMSVAEGVDYLMRQPKWQQLGVDHTREVVRNQFASGKQNQRPTITAFSASTSPLAVVPGGTILFESTLELGRDSDSGRTLLASYWPTMMTHNADSHVLTAPAHISVHSEVTPSTGFIKVNAYADVLDCERARVLVPGSTKAEVNECFTDAFSNRGPLGERTNPGIIIRLVDAGTSQPLRCYDIRCSKTPHQYVDQTTLEQKVRNLSADAITTLLQIWKAERQHEYMPTLNERNKALLRDDLLRIVLSAVGQSDAMTAKMVSPLLSGSGREDAERIFRDIRSGRYKVEIIPYQRIDASKVMRDTLRKELSEAMSKHHVATQAAQRSNLPSPVYVNPYDRYTRTLAPGVKGEPLYAETHIAVSIMGAGSATGGIPTMTKFIYRDFVPQYASLTEVATPNIAGAVVERETSAPAKPATEGQKQPPKIGGLHRGPIARAENLGERVPSTSIPLPVEKPQARDILKEIRAAAGALCRESSHFGVAAHRAEPKPAQDQSEKKKTEGFERGQNNPTLG